MRRLLALIVIFAACVAGALAETHYKPHISVGGRAGATLSQMSFSPSVKQKWATGTTGAVTFRYTEEKLFGLIAELGWVQRGWAEDFELSPLRYSRSLTYIQLPVLTHIYFGTDRFRAFFNLGPQIDFLIGQHISANFDYHKPLEDPRFPSRKRQTEQLWADATNHFDYGICASAGMEFYIHPRHSILLEGRFYYGLGNIFPSSKADTFGASRCMSIELTLGYNFRLR